MTKVSAVTPISHPSPVPGSSSAGSRRLRWVKEYTANYLVTAPLATLAIVLSTLVLLIQLSLGHEKAMSLTFQPGNITNPWVVFTGIFSNYKPGATIFFIFLLALLGPLVERTLGTWRFALTATASYLMPITLLTVIFSAASSLIPGWAQALTEHSVFGLPLMLTGSLLASTRVFPTIWRRRTRLLVCLTTVILLGFGGSLQDIGLFLAALTGWASGVVLSSPHHSEHSLVGTRHETRTLVALSITAVSLGIFFAAHAPHPVGPLASARFDIATSALTNETLDAVCANNSASKLCSHEVYLAQTRGILPSTLSIFPVVFQLVLALGLARGRRFAAYGTVFLQGTIFLFTALRLIIYSGVLGEHRSLFGTFAELEDAGARLIVPVLIPFSMIILIIATWRYFPLQSNRKTIRQATRTIGLVGLSGAALMTVVAWIMPQGFAPQPQLFTFALDYLTKLLPSAAWYVFPPAYAGTFWLTTTLHWILPALFWCAVIICIYRVVTQPMSEKDKNRERFIELVRNHGAGTLGWISTWDNRRYWISESGQEGFAYLAHQGVALTVGDPVATPDRVESAVREFSKFCTSSGLTPALYSVHSPTQQVAQELGWSCWQVAEEAIIELPQLAFSGKKFQSIRTALNQAEKNGITARWTNFNSLLLAEWTQIVEISEGWVSDKNLPEMGFTLGGLEELKDPETRILLAIDESGFIHGVTSWMPVHREGKVIGLTLDFMRRRNGDDVFSASMEFLIASAAQDAKEEGLELLSLSGAPLAHSSSPLRQSNLDKLLDYLGKRMEPLYGFRSLLTFKSKFRPVFEPMYLVTPDSGKLASIGLAVAHAYLPEMKAKDVLGIVQAMGSKEK